MALLFACTPHKSQFECLRFIALHRSIYKCENEKNRKNPRKSKMVHSRKRSDPLRKATFPNVDTQLLRVGSPQLVVDECVSEYRNN